MKPQVRPGPEDGPDEWRELINKENEQPFNVFGLDPASYPPLPHPSAPIGKQARASSSQQGAQPEPTSLGGWDADVIGAPNDAKGAELIEEAQALKRRVVAVCKSWSHIFVSKIKEGSSVLKNPNDDPFGMEDMFNAFLIENGRAGKGKRTLGDAYVGQEYPIPYRGPVHISNIALDVGNVLYQFFMLVEKYTCNRAIPGMAAVLRSLAEILHPDLFYFITWGAEPKALIKNLAGFNFMNKIWPNHPKIREEDREPVDGPRFTQTYCELFRSERGCQGVVVCPDRTNPKSTNKWVNSPKCYYEYSEDHLPYRKLDPSQYRWLDNQYKRFTHFDYSWSSYTFLSSDNKCGEFKHDGNFTFQGKIQACKDNDIRVLVDDCHHQCEYLDKMRRSPNLGAYSVMPVFVKARTNDEGNERLGYTKRGYEGLTADRAVEAIGVVAEFCFEAIRHNEANGHNQEKIGSHAHFGEKWKERPILKTQPYPKAFGIDKNRGVDLARLGLPAINEDGDITTKWYESKALVAELLEPTREYEKLRSDIRDHKMKVAEYQELKQTADGASGGVQSDGMQQVEDANAEKDLPQSEQKELEAAKLAQDNLRKFGAKSGICNLCSTPMTYEKFAHHKCSKVLADGSNFKLLTWSHAVPVPAGTGKSLNAAPTAKSSDDEAAIKMRASRLQAIDENGPSQPANLTSIDDIDVDNVMLVDDDSLRERFIERLSGGRKILVVAKDHFNVEEGFTLNEFNPTLVQFDENQGLEGTKQEIEERLKTLAALRCSDAPSEKIYWHENDKCIGGCDWHRVQSYLQRDNESFREDINGTSWKAEGISPENWFPTHSDHDLERTPRYVRFNQGLPAFFRRLYLFHPADKRGLYLDRFGAVIENVSPMMAMGRVLKLRWSYNFCAAMIRAPTLENLIESEAFLHKGVAEAYARGHIPYLWVTIWVSQDTNGRPVGNSLATLHEMDEQSSTQGVFGSFSTDTDGMAVSRDPTKHKALFSYVSSLQCIDDPYAKYRKASASGGNSGGQHGSADDGPKDPFAALNNMDKHGTEGGDDHFKEWAENSSAIIKDPLPDTITMVMARDIIDAEQNRVGVKRIRCTDPFPNLDFDNFRYFAQVICDKCPIYRERYDGNKDYVRQSWDNSIGREKKCTFLPNGTPKYWREGPDTIFRRGEWAEISSVDYPGGHFQSAKLVNSVTYKDEDGATQKEILAYINLFKTKKKLYDGDRQGGVRYAALMVLPGKGLIVKMRTSPISLMLARPEVLAGESVPLAGDMEISEEELKALDEFLKRKFNSHANAKNVLAKVHSRTEVGDIEMKYLRTFGILNQDDEMKHRQSLMEFAKATVNFMRSQCPESPTSELEKARRTAVRSQCERTSSTVVNAAVLKRYIDFSDMKGYGYDGLQPDSVRRMVNLLLSGHPGECPDMEEGCWVPIHSLMIALQNKLSVGYQQKDRDPNECQVVRGAICSVHKVLLALADATHCPFEIRLQLAAVPNDVDANDTDVVATGGKPVYHVVPCHGVDITIGTAVVPKWASTHREHMSEVNALPQYKMPTLWDTKVKIAYTDGISREHDMTFEREMMVTHIRRAHGFAPECKFSPKQWIDFTRSAAMLATRGDFTKERAERELTNVPNIMYIVTKKANLKYICEWGCVVSERTYPISGNLRYDPLDMRTPILLSATPPWDRRSHISPGGHLRINMDGFCYLVVDTEALVFDGWRFTLEDDGLWRLWWGFGNAYLIGAIQDRPTFQLLQWRTFIRTGFDWTSNSRWRARYMQYRTPEGEMHTVKAMFDKVMPIKKCVKCDSCLTIDTYLCAECDYPAFPGTWTQSKWYIPREVRKFGIKMETKANADAIYLYNSDLCKRWRRTSDKHDVGEHWDENYYSWETFPLNYVNPCSELDAEIANYEGKLNRALSQAAFREFTRVMQNIQKESERCSGEYKTSLMLARSTSDFLRLCVQIGSLSRVLDAAISRKFEVEHTRRIEDVLRAAKMVSGNVIDLESLRRSHHGKGGDRVKGDTWRMTPETLGKKIDGRESSNIAKARKYVRNNPGLQPGTPTLSLVGHTMSRFTSTVDRLTKDTLHRMRLERAWNDSASRLDSPAVRYSSAHYLAWCYEEKMRMEKSKAKVEDRHKYAWVPVIEDLGNDDKRDGTLEAIRGRYLEIWEMAKVKRIDIGNLDDWIRKNEVIVPNTLSEAKLGRFRFDTMLKSTSLLAIEDAKEEGSAMKVGEGSLAYIWNYARSNACCRCGAQHPRSSVSKLMSCAMCNGPVCNKECSARPCNGDPLAGAIIPPMNKNSERNMVRPLHDDPNTDDRIGSEGGIASSSGRRSGHSLNATSMARRNGGANQETACDGGNLPFHKRINPETSVPYTFDELECMQSGRDPMGRSPDEVKAKRDELYYRDRRQVQSDWDKSSSSGDHRARSHHGWSQPHWKNESWDQSWGSRQGWHSKPYAASTAGTWSGHSGRRYNSEGSGQRQQAPNAWEREQQYEERNAKRKGRYQAEGPRDRPEFHEFTASCNRDDSGEARERLRLRSVGPTRFPSRDIRKGFRNAWKPSIVLTDAPGTPSEGESRDRSRSRHSGGREGVTLEFIGDNGERVQSWRRKEPDDNDASSRR